MTAQLNRNGRGILLMVLAIFLFTVMDATAKGLVRSYPTNQVIWARFTGQFLIVLVILRLNWRVMLQTEHPVLHLFRSLSQMGAAACFFASLPYIGLAEATAVTDLNPVLITVGAALFLKEQIGPRRIFGVLVALVGGLIVIRPGLGVFTPAALLPLGAAIFYSATALLTRFLGKKESYWTAMLHTAFVGSLLSSMTLPVSFAPIQAGDLPLFVMIGIIGTLGQLCLIRSFSMAEASAVAPFAYLGLIFATFWGITLYGEYPDRWTVIGALVIVAAGLYVWHRETQGQRSSTE